MKFTEVEHTLYQAKIKEIRQINAKEFILELVYRIPTLPVLGGYKLLPGYSIVPPSKVQIDKSNLFAYLTYCTAPLLMFDWMIHAIGYVDINQEAIWGRGSMMEVISTNGMTLHPITNRNYEHQELICQQIVPDEYWNYLKYHIHEESPGWPRVTIQFPEWFYPTFRSRSQGYGQISEDDYRYDGDGLFVRDNLIKEFVEENY